jgi:hypothetical protein
MSVASLAQLTSNPFLKLRQQKWHCHSQFLRIKTKAALLQKVA